MAAKKITLEFTGKQWSRLQVALAHVYSLEKRQITDEHVLAHIRRSLKGFIKRALASKAQEIIVEDLKNEGWERESTGDQRSDNASPAAPAGTPPTGPAASNSDAGGE